MCVRSHYQPCCWPRKHKAFVILKKKRRKDWKGFRHPCFYTLGGNRIFSPLLPHKEKYSSFHISSFFQHQHDGFFFFFQTSWKNNSQTSITGWGTQMRMIAHAHLASFFLYIIWTFFLFLFLLKMHLVPPFLCLVNFCSIIIISSFFLEKERLFLFKLGKNNYFFIY